MRYLFCLSLGLMLGAIVSLMGMRTLQQRNAYPRSLMVMMQYELHHARDAARLTPCNSESVATAVSNLRLLAMRIESAFPTQANNDKIFSRYTQDLLAELGAIDHSSSCSSQVDTLTQISNACEACHRDYR